MDYITLNNGVEMPQLGYGVFQIPNEETREAVLTAIEVGYRSIDTAQAYGNEAGVGEAVATCGVPRDELFLTTKVWMTNVGYERCRASIEESLARLRTDYIDLLLVHQPFGDYYGAWRAMEEAYDAGKLRAIGVSNFKAERYLDIEHFSRVKPAVDQLETHVFNQQKVAQHFLEKHGARLEAWSPFAEGKNGFFTNPTLTEVGAAHGKTAAQAALRYMLQRGIIVIPKSSHRDRMEQNFDVFDFVTGQIFLPIGGFLTCLFLGWFVPRKLINDEFTNGGTAWQRSGRWLFAAFLFLIRFVCPLCILAIFLNQLGIIHF